jgi:hypothetical protein
MKITGIFNRLKKQPKRIFSSVISGVLATNLIYPFINQNYAFAQTTSYCQLTPETVRQKDELRQAALSGDRNAQQLYADTLIQHAREVGHCRTRTWPRTQAIWLRLYPCDAKPGAIERLLDDIVNRGYNEVYVEAFYDGQVLLPVAQNPTVWPSVIRTPGYERLDILGETIKQGKMRGLRMYAWVFTINFGYTYSQIPGREQALARNGKGQTSLSIIQDQGVNDQAGESHANNAFIDPYNPDARQDYNVMVNAMLQRRPDGILFDYVRYLRGIGENSIADNAKDLWIYGQASQEAILKRANNLKGKELITRFLRQGYLNDQDLSVTSKLPGSYPFWQAQNILGSPVASTEIVRSSLIDQLWLFTVAHATQGILDFVDLAIKPAEEKGIKTGAVFFPEGNRPIKGGFDSRLQPWEQFPDSMEFHPMVYGACGENNTSCLTPQVERVVKMAPSGVKIIPALAGVWGQPYRNRPSLEVQMDAVRSVAPQINAVSHFSYDWQEPGGGRERKFCRL